MSPNRTRKGASFLYLFTYSSIVNVPLSLYSRVFQYDLLMFFGDGMDQWYAVPRCVILHRAPVNGLGVVRDIRCVLVVVPFDGIRFPRKQVIKRDGLVLLYEKSIEAPDKTDILMRKKIPDELHLPPEISNFHISMSY